MTHPEEILPSKEDIKEELRLIASRRAFYENTLGPALMRAKSKMIALKDEIAELEDRYNRRDEILTEIDLHHKHLTDLMLRHDELDREKRVAYEPKERVELVKALQYILSKQELVVNYVLVPASKRSDWARDQYRAFRKEQGNG